MRRGRSIPYHQSPRSYVGDSRERQLVLWESSDRLLELWKELWRYALENDSVELVATLSNRDFPGRLYSHNKDEQAHELIDRFNEFIAQAPLCFIAPRYLTMEHLMHEHREHLAAPFQATEE
jgi:hypothetical protein